MGLILIILKVVVFVWDFLTYPIYQAIYRPWEYQKNRTKIRARLLEQHSTSNEVVYEKPQGRSQLYNELVQAKVETVEQAFRWATAKYGSLPCFGTREILRVEDEVQSNGRLFRKYLMGDYRWVSFEDAGTTVDYLGRGLQSLGLEKGMNVCIFADTRVEWMYSAQACLRHGLPLVTLYTNLGEDAIIHGINETTASMVITSHELLPKIKSILDSTPLVKKVVFFEHQVETTDVEGIPPDVEVVRFYKVVSAGRKLAKNPAFDPVAPSKDDTAVIMYTSGSTGAPKGVILTQNNIYQTLISYLLALAPLKPKNEVYMAFLPLAHILELVVELDMVLSGFPIGYSSPNTMIDKSSMIKKGCKGDASVLRPTVIVTVPLILDRVYKAILEQVRQKGPAFQEVFHWAIKYSEDSRKKGLGTPILNATLFRPLRALLGGRVKWTSVGGAPLSADCHRFIRTCLGLTLYQGYGLTETAGSATLMDVSDMESTEIVGPPLPWVQIKLVNWDEGNYRVTDKPCPRGEIIVGGSSIANGYYKQEEKSKEDFYFANGRRWLRTGDIGLFTEQGDLKIIDRKKDLVKLQFGEYVSLGKVEAVLKTCPVVENVCIYGDPLKSYCVALVSPDRAALKDLAARHGVTNLTFEDLCDSRDVTGAVLREITNHSKKMRLEKFEVPGAVTLVKDVWIPDSGLVTVSFKLRRKPIQLKYQLDIDRMYGDGGGHHPTTPSATNSP